MPEVQLRVDSAYPGDQGGGKARLDPETMLLLKISPGDLVVIEGKKRTVAKVWRALVEDWNQRKIRIDNFTRLNAGVSIGDTVKISTISDEIEAKRIVLAPPEDLPKKIPIANNPHVINGLIDFPVVKNDSIPIMLGLPFIQPQIVAFKVVEIEPEEAVIITKNTSIEFSDKPAAGFEGVKRFSYEDIGGLKDELQRLRETIELPLRHPELFQKLGIEPPKGVLLYGPPGTGKTLIAKAVASESGAHFISIAGPEVISKYYGESEQRLREVFEEARENAPSIIFIDELDSIAPRREEVTGEVERRVVAQLLTMMDGLEERGQVVVIGATNRVDAIDAALRRPGRFDREIEIGVPSELDRIEILKIHTRNMPFAEDKEPIRLTQQILNEVDQQNIKEAEDKAKDKFLKVLAEQTHGFVGADLAALAREAAIRGLRRYLPSLSEHLDADEIPPEILDTLKVFASDFRSAQRDVGPSAMREVMLEVSHVKWENVGGLESAKIEVREAIEKPLTNRQEFEDLGIEPPRGVLLYGPPGTGKTLIAKAVASESGANFIPVRGPQLLSKWVGESERAVREIFKKARQVSPSIIFFDEIDALAPSRGTSSDSHVSDNVLNQILTEMDGLVELKDVVVMGATNRPDIVDPALLRAGRFDRLVYIGEPNQEDRNSILNVHSKFLPIEGASFEEVLDLTKFFDENNLEKLIDVIPGKDAITAGDIKDTLLKIREKRIEDLLKANKLKLVDVPLYEFALLSLSVDDLTLDKIILSFWKEQQISKEDINKTLKEIKHQKIIDTESETLEIWKKKITSQIDPKSMDLTSNGFEFFIDNSRILGDKGLHNLINTISKWQSIRLNDITKLIKEKNSPSHDLSERDDRTRFISKIIENEYEPRKIVFKNLSVEKIVEITSSLNKTDLDTVLKSFIKEQSITKDDILKNLNEIQISPNNKLKENLNEERRIKIKSMLEHQKLTLKNFTLDGFLNLIQGLSELNVEYLISILRKKQEIHETEISEAVREVRLNLIVKIRENKKLTFDGFSDEDLIKKTAFMSETHFEDLLEEIWILQGIREVRRRDIVDFLIHRKLKLKEEFKIFDLVDVTIINKIRDCDLENFIEMFRKEQPVNEGELIDYIHNLNQPIPEVIRRSIRRRKILELLDIRKMKFEDPRKNALLKNIVSNTEGYSGADLESLCREAGMLALREGVLVVTDRHFDEAIKKVHPTMNENLRMYYAKIQQHFKGGLPKQVQPPEYQ